MFKNSIIITLRSLATHRAYTFINILGLAVGMACALLIAIYVIHETSYDKFHSDADRIYRISIDGKLQGQDLEIAVSPPPMAGTIAEEYAEVEAAVRMVRFGAWLVANNETSYNEDNLLFADSNFFHFFSFPLILGNPDTALLKPRSLVLSRSSAIKYFGNIDVVGKSLKIEDYDNLFTVTGVMEDLPSNSHINVDIIGSMATVKNYLRPMWSVNNVYTYIKLKPNTDVVKLEEKVNKLVEIYFIPEVKKFFRSSEESFHDGTNNVNYKLQPIRKIHLYSDLDIEIEQNSKALYVYTFGIIAILVLIIACLNFINLSTANSSNRAREVVLRKVIGSERRMLIFQFLTESILFSYFALILALLMVEIVMPHFNEYLGLELNFQYLKSFSAIIVILLFTSVLGVLAGSYPAFFISSYDPARVLHGVLNKGIKSQRVRSVFVIIQFFISILIIIITIVVFAQVEYMMGKKLGFIKERVVVIRRPDALGKKIDLFKEEILKYPNIESVSNSNSIPGRNFLASNYMVEGDSGRHNIFMRQIFVSHDFRDAFGLEMAEGRFFSSSIDSDRKTCIVNETAAHKIQKANILGTYLEPPTLKNKKGGEQIEIIGIVKDFHYESVDKPIDPLVISLMPGNWEGYLNVRLSNKGMDNSIKYLEETWKKYTPNYPFLYFFLDEDFNENYISVVRIGKLLLIFSLLSIFVACLGLFGLVLFTSNQRTQEIGVRKAVGATFYQIITLLLKETIFHILIASAFAWIAAYFLANFWLRDFSSRIALSPKFFVVSTIIVLLLSILVVFYQTLLASKYEPSKALKEE